MVIKRQEGKSRGFLIGSNHHVWGGLIGVRWEKDLWDDLIGWVEMR